MKTTMTRTSSTSSAQNVSCAGTSTASTRLSTIWKANWISSSACSMRCCRKTKEEQPARLPRKVYEKELLRLQAELVKLQEWVRAERPRIVVIFEGRDAAGKSSTIKRVTEYLNPRVARIAALPAPTEREQAQWYFRPAKAPRP